MSKLILGIIVILAVASISFKVNADAIWPFEDQQPIIEHGKNYDRIDIGAGNYVWTSKPDRIEDYPNHFVDYQYFDSANTFKYQSATTAARINKDTCTIQLYDEGKIGNGETPVINSITHIVKEADASGDNWNYASVNDAKCSFTFSETDGRIKATTTKTNFNVVSGGTFSIDYDFDHAGKLKWSYKYTNQDVSKTNQKYGFTTIFNGGFIIKVNGQEYNTSTITDEIDLKPDEFTTIQVKDSNGYDIFFDPQNYIHNYLWIVKIQNGKIVFDFTYAKGALGVGQTLTVDPTFGYADSTLYRATTAASAAASCSTTGGSISSATEQYDLPASAVNDACQLSSFQWDTTTIPDSAIPTDIKVRYDVTVTASPRNCDFTGVIGRQPSTFPNNSTGAIELFNMIRDSTQYGTNFNQCTTIANDKVATLNGTAKTDLQTMLASGKNWFAIGMKPNSMTRDASEHQVQFSGTTELQVTYSLPQLRYENKPFMSDGSTIIGPATMDRRNATNSELTNTNSSGYFTYTNTVSSANYNYTIKEATDNFVVNKTNNKSIITPQSQTGTTQVYNVDCSPGVDTDFRVKLNFTNYHILTLTTPVCNSDGDISFTAQFLKQGLGPATNQTTKFIDRVIDTSEYSWPPGKLLDNGTSRTGTYISNNIVNFTGIPVGNGYNTIAKRFILYTDNVTSAPQSFRVNTNSATSIKLFWQLPASNHGAAPYSFYITRNGTMLQNSTGNVLTYTDNTVSTNKRYDYTICAWNRIGCSPMTSGTNNTHVPGGFISITGGNIGDTENINATINISGAGYPMTIDSVSLYRNASLIQTNNTDLTVTSGNGFERIWYQMVTDNANVFAVKAQVTNNVGTVTLATNSNITATREYDPSYFNALENPTVQGLVNYTVQRFNDEDGVLLHVNRQGGTLGQTWQIECIVQDNSEAANTRNETENWSGTWINYTNTGYFNGTWNNLRNTHAYITCFNDAKLFTVTSFTNSSLSLFGIQIFDESYGSMLGVPVGVFFLAMAGAMANKRTAPTWIIVVLAMAGTMAAIGFFTLNPLVWGLALVAALCGVFVNQKIF